MFQSTGAEPLCGRLPLDEGAAIFLATTDGGQLRRTSRWPKDDTHPEARTLCALCPVQAACLADALANDRWSFRCLSPEERAAFGGARSKMMAARPVRVSRDEVAGRIVECGYDYEALWQVLVDWDRQLQQMPAKELSGLYIGDDKVGWSAPVVEQSGGLSGVDALEWMAARVEGSPSVTLPPPPAHW